MAPISASKFTTPQAVFDDLEYQFTLTPDTLVSLTRAFLDEFKIGLGSYNQAMAMIPSFVTGVPDGTETGTFLALDLGGTNLRVCEVVLNGDKTFSLRQQKYRVSETLKHGDASALFDYLASSVDAFLTEHAKIAYTYTSPDSDLQPDAIHLGLTFSFPVEQTALGSGNILTWTKGFSAKNAIGHDVVKLLQDAFDKKHMHVKCVALVNDTVGALLSRSYTAGGCIVGAIFGTGTNGAYVEKIANIKKLAGTPITELGTHMIINTEWGAFNNSRRHLPVTSYDQTVDRLSINPSYQAFEKFVSGMYLGEITRVILASLIDATPKALLFEGKATHVLNTHYGLDTSFMSNVEIAWMGKSEDKEEQLPPFGSFDESKISATLKASLGRVRAVVVEYLKFKPEEVSLLDAGIIRWVCALVAHRAALLSGVALATVCIQTEHASLLGDVRPVTHSPSPNAKIIVGVDGSLVEHYPNFEGILRKSLRVLVGEDVEMRVDIGLAKDGSGVGAALCALQALKQTH